MAADLGDAVCPEDGAQTLAGRLGIRARNGDEKRQPHAIRRIADDLATRFGNQRRQGIAPALDLDAKEDDFAGRRVLDRLRYDEDRQPGRMVRPLDERQARDDLWRLRVGEPAPPGTIR